MFVTAMRYPNLLVVAALVAASGCSLSGSGDHPKTPIQSRVAPRAPLSQSACVAEIRGWHFSLTQARPVCASARSQTWFHATITNQSAPATYVRCAITAWDKNGHQLFFGFLPLSEISFPAGMYLDRHQTRSIDWFFDGDLPQAAGHAHDVIRYTTVCTPWKNPPI